MFSISVHLCDTRNEVHSSSSGFHWLAVCGHIRDARLIGQMMSGPRQCSISWLLISMATISPAVHPLVAGVGGKHRNDLQQSDLKRNDTDSRELQMENGDLGHMVRVCVCPCVCVFSLLCFRNVTVWQFGFLVR